MKLDYLPIDGFSKDLERVKSLYIEAFPENERPDFYFNLSSSASTFYSIHNEEDEYVGFIDIVLQKDFLYIFFFAFTSENRGKGYGTQALRDVVAANKDKRIFLLIEEVRKESDNYEERAARKAFYLKRGFSSHNLIVEENGDRYELLSYGNANIGENEFLDVMISSFGEKLAREYYPYLYN